MDQFAKLFASTQAKLDQQVAGAERLHKQLRDTVAGSAPQPVTMTAPLHDCEQPSVTAPVAAEESKMGAYTRTFSLSSTPCHVVYTLACLPLCSFRCIV